MCVHVEKHPIGVLKSFASFTGKHVSGLRAPTLLKKQHQQRRFLGNFANFFRVPILKNAYGRLLLYVTQTTAISTKLIWFYKT